MSDTVLYPRVSTEDQQDRGTIETQIQFGTKYCDLHEIPLADPHYYKDDGISGTIPLHERPGGSRLIEDAKAGKIKIVLVYKLDRLGRTARVILNAIYDLEQYGVQVRSMTEPFDTSTPAGRFALTILAGVADLDRTTTLERLWLGANRWAREGKWLGGIVPYGYYVNADGYLDVNETPIPGFHLSEAGVIRLIYFLVAEQKMSTKKVADYLNALAIPTSYVIHARQLKRGKRKVKTSGHWNPGRIRNMLVNTTYMGIHHYGKRSQKVREIITREVPSIVSEETWNTARQVLKDNMIEATRCAKRQYLLRSLIKCDCCGLNYSGTSFKGPKGKPKAYYVCNGKTTYRGPLQGKCASKNIPAEWIEDFVWQDCVNFIMSPGEAIAEINNNEAEIQKHSQSLQEQIEIIQKSIQDKETEKQSILDLFRKQFISAKDVELQLEKINNEKLILEENQKSLTEEANSQKDISVKMRSAEQLLLGLQDKLNTDDLDYEVKREIIKTLVKEVRIKTKNPEDDLHQLQATVAITYTFSQDTLRTDRDSSQR